MKIEDYLDLIGSSYVFPDGIKIKIIDIKQRAEAIWIIHETDYGNSLPRRFSSTLKEFLETYGHLWNK